MIAMRGSYTPQRTAVDDLRESSFVCCRRGQSSRPAVFLAMSWTRRVARIQAGEGGITLHDRCVGNVGFIDHEAAAAILVDRENQLPANAAQSFGERSRQSL